MKKKPREHISFCLRQSPFGPFAVTWSYHVGHASICRVLLTSSRKNAYQNLLEAYPGAEQNSCFEIDMIADQLEAFLNGEDIRFSLDMLRLDLCSNFQLNVLSAEHKIPRGGISTYQKLAIHLGNPGSARAVGSALANNPFPIIIPCHRVLRSDGTIGGYQGGREMKMKLLEMEGIRFNSIGRVLLF